MSRQVLWPVWLLATCVWSVQSSLLPYGDTEGHIATPGIDDGSGPSLSLQPPFRFYGTNYSTAFVNNDGSVTFTKAVRFQETTSDPGDTPAVCGLCCDIDVTVSGTVWYVLSTASSLRQTVAEDVRRYLEFPAVYTPSWVLLATWADVATYNSEDNKVDTFQITMATDGTASFVILFYEKIEWVYDNSDVWALYLGTEPSVRSQSGFQAGDGVRSYLLPGSMSDELINITKLSNVGAAGKFIFRVDSDILPVHLPDTTSSAQRSTDTTTPTTIADNITPRQSTSSTSLTSTSTSLIQDTTPHSDPTSTTPALLSDPTSTTPDFSSDPTSTTPTSSSDPTSTTSSLLSDQTSTKPDALSDPTSTTPASSSDPTLTTPALLSDSTSTTTASSDLTTAAHASSSHPTLTTPSSTSDLTSTAPASSSDLTSTTPSMSSDLTSATTASSNPTSTAPALSSDPTLTSPASSSNVTSTTTVSSSDSTQTTPDSPTGPKSKTPASSSDPTSTTPDSPSDLTSTAPASSGPTSTTTASPSDETSTTPDSLSHSSPTTPARDERSASSTSLHTSALSVITPHLVGGALAVAILIAVGVLQITLSLQFIQKIQGRVSTERTAETQGCR